uniref:Uncharacterized protein n=1 Tax=Arundo donax TaxID=35708 RepID=A0A0A9CQ92_ARUDO
MQQNSLLGATSKILVMFTSPKCSLCFLASRCYCRVGHFRSNVSSCLLANTQLA